MATKFTEDQLKAVNTVDRSVLVAAAAGSGKTTVLINRIIGIILDGRANADEMLVVTFTKAAAAEMRLRLGSAIRRRIREHPGDATRMREQLARLYRAYISTIDSFVLRVVREFFHEIDIEPEFSICDEVQAELMKREAAAELLEEAFEEDELIEGGSFREFMRLYGDERSDEKFMHNLIRSYEALRTMPDYFTWAYDKAGDLRITADTFEGSALHEAVRNDAKDTFETAARGARTITGIMEDAGLSALCERKLAEEFAGINDIYSELESGRLDEELMSRIGGFSWARLVASGDEKEAWETVKDEIKDIRDTIKEEINDFTYRYLTPDFTTCLAQMNATYDYTIYYLKLLEEFEKRYADKKRRKRLMDFADVSHAAAEILKNDEAAEVLRRRFKYVFVDEYQDTNNLQEYLIGRVSGSRNVFKVGDIKQSIYKFRLAEPEIFERLAKEYSDESNTDGEVINLSANFRTNDRTIKYINHVFENVMDGYDEDARLHTGITSIPDEYDFKPEVHVLLKGGTDEEAADEEVERLSADEAEAEYIAELAAGIIGTEFYDAKRGALRRAEPRDIAILMRSVKVTGERIYSALARRSVESHIEETDDYFNTLEVDIALSLFSCIDNMKRDLPLIATLHSEVFGFDPEELARIRIAYTGLTGDKRLPYFDAFKWYASEGPSGSLTDKVRAAYSQLLEWRKLSRIMPLPDFIWKVLTDSGYYRAAGAMSGGSRRQANLRALADRAERLSSENVASLSSFITFVEVMKSKNISNGQLPMAGKDDNLVRIMTMHKSKGLEFPFVIVGGLGRRFNRDKYEKKFTFDSGVGVGMPYIDPDRRFWRASMMQTAMKAKSDRADYKEDIRLLYVDMTRAGNKLHLVGTADSMESLSKFGKPNNYLKVIRDFINTPYNEYHILPLQVKKNNDVVGKDDIVSAEDIKLSSEASALYNEIDRRFSFVYPQADKLTAKSKYSVSAIRREELAAAAGPDDEGEETEASSKDAEIVKLWEGAERRKKAGAADIGIAYHRIMEFIDFRSATREDGSVDADYINERARFLHARNAIDDDVFESLDINRIVHFFKTDIGKRAACAAREGSLKREKPFTLKTERNGREILVQGVIDCCFEEKGQMVLLDYKSSFVREGRRHEAELKRIRDEYKVQIELYSEAVRKGTGLEVGEAYLYLFSTGEALKI